MPTLPDLIRALPAEFDRSDSATDRVERLLRGLSETPPPRSRIVRMWALGGLPVKIGAAYLAYWIRSSFAGAGDDERLRNEADLTAALRILATMGYLRGPLVKVGQILAAYPDVVPDVYAELFSCLHAEAPPMHYALVREVVRNELGRDPADAFARFEPDAFAAASLGQVHRAQLHTGERVAVKVQYPGMREAIRSDIKNLGAAMWSMKLTRSGRNLREQSDAIAAMLAQETDYGIESELQQRARAALCDLDEVRVPEVHGHYSTQRVLTMEYLDGVHLQAFLDSGPSQRERDRRGRQIVAADQRLLYGARMCYSDPSPGNVLFLPDGRLGLLDFGACKRLDGSEWDYALLMQRACRDGGQTLERALIAAAQLDEHQARDQAWRGFLEEMCDWLWRPLRHDGAFDFGDEAYLKQGMRLQGEAIRRRRTQSRPVNVWFTRNAYALRAMLFRLRARVDFREIYEREVGPLIDGA